MRRVLIDELAFGLPPTDRVCREVVSKDAVVGESETPIVMIGPIELNCSVYERMERSSPLLAMANEELAYSSESSAWYLFIGKGNAGNSRTVVVGLLGKSQ